MHANVCTGGSRAFLCAARNGRAEEEEARRYRSSELSFLNSVARQGYSYDSREGWQPASRPADRHPKIRRAPSPEYRNQILKSCTQILVFILQHYDFQRSTKCIPLYRSEFNRREEKVDFHQMVQM